MLDGVLLGRADGVSNPTPPGGGIADSDEDGLVDVLVANNGDPPILPHNGGNRFEFQAGGNER